MNPPPPTNTPLASLSAPASMASTSTPSPAPPGSPAAIAPSSTSVVSSSAPAPAANTEASTSTSEAAVPGTSFSAVATTPAPVVPPPPPLPSGPSKKQEEAATRDKTLAEFMLMLDDHEPLIPEEITAYYLQRAGFESSDPRLKRLLSLAAQKFVSDLATDAYQHARVRMNAVPAARGRPPTNPAKGKDRTVLTMEDLTASLGERGVHLKKPEYYQ